MATELCAGTLYDLYNGKYNGPEVGDCRLVLREITSGLQYLHSFKIAHGDLKPSNILISIPKDNSSPKMKLADFGLSHAVRNKDDTGYEENQFRPAFSKGWMCPFDAVGDDGKRELSFDVFPLGVLFAFAALKGVHPFGRDIDEAMENINNRQPLRLNVILRIDPSVRSPPFLQLLAEMVSYDPSQRPTSLEIFNHPFFTQQPIMAPARKQHLENAPVEPLPSTSTARQPNGEAQAKKIKNRATSPLNFSTTSTGAQQVANIKKKTVDRVANYNSNSSGEKEEENSTGSSEEAEGAEEVDTSKQQQNFPCDICDRQFSSKAMLLTHIRVHIEEKPFKCKTCDYESTSKGNLKSHISTVHDKPHKCDICGKSFAYKNSLLYHINSHTGARPYKCGQCPKSYGSSPALSLHRKTHSPPSYKCEFCGKMFSQLANLKTHRDGNKQHGIGCKVRRQQLEQQKSD